MTKIPILKVISCLIITTSLVSCRFQEQADSNKISSEVRDEKRVDDLNNNVNFLPTSTTNQIITHDGYVLS